MILDRTNKPIILSGQNIDNIIEKDIVAWTYASSGAMGRPGEITVATVHYNSFYLYRVDYLSNPDIQKELFNRFPTVFKRDSNGWKSISMGMGNLLNVRENLEYRFNQKLMLLGEHIYPSHLRVLYQVLNEMDDGKNKDNILRKILKDYPDILDNMKLFKALLSDYLPDDKLSRNLILGSVEEEIPQTILRNNVLTDQEIYRLENKIVSAYGCDHFVAGEIINMWVDAITD